MLAIVGDIHGDFWTFHDIVKQIHEERPEVTAVIQVGDFGYFPDNIRILEQCTFDLPVYWIDGNHEYFELFIHNTVPIEIHTNCFYVPRGTVLNLDGKTIAFMGGAGSIDKKIRLQYKWHWSELENITDEQFHRLDSVECVDLLITHSPPQSVVTRNFDNSPRALHYFGAPGDWFDPNAHLIESLWSRLNYPPMYCGHMHRSIVDRKCRILNIEEVVYHE